MELFSCPVRDVQAASAELALFDACYQVEVFGLGGAGQYHLTALPARGGMLEQPARTMAALQVIERIANDELAADLREDRAARRRADRERDRADG